MGPLQPVGKDDLLLKAQSALVCSKNYINFSFQFTRRVHMKNEHRRT
jgi:hypothetical protein